MKLFLFWVVFLPNKPDPLGTFFPIEFIQLFHQDWIILEAQVDDSQTTFILGHHD